MMLKVKNKDLDSVTSDVNLGTNPNHDGTFPGL